MWPLLFVLCFDLFQLAAGKLLRFTGVVFEKNGSGSFAFELVEALFRVAVVDVQADWPGWLLATCLRYWRHGVYPCPCCDVKHFGNLNAITSSGGPWEDYTHDSWLADVASHKKVLAML